MRRHAALILTVTLLAPAAALAGTPGVPLIAAVRAGDVAAVRTLVREHADVNAADPDGSTALHWAADRGEPQLTELLLRSGANVAAATRYGVKPLSLAAANGNARTIELLLKAGADPNTAMLGGETALMTAARAGRTDAVRALLMHGANPNAREATRGQTALMWAAAEGQADAVRLLVQHGADLRAVSHAPAGDPHITDGEESPNASGGKRVAPRVDVFTPLQFAVHAGHIDAARALIELGANIADETPQGMNTLVLAIANAHYELAALLLDKGADPNASKAGFSALHQISRMRTLNIGLFPHPVPSGSLTSLDLAKALLAHGAAVDARTTRTFPDGYRNPPVIHATPLLIAAKGTDVDMMRLLIAHGADPLAKNINGHNALMLVTGMEQFNANEDSGTNPDAVRAARFVLDLGLDVNERNRSGESPLHGAVWRGSNELIQLLVDRGAKLDARNGSGLTPLQTANGECVFVEEKKRGNITSFCYWVSVMVWTRPQVVPLLRELMLARGLTPEMRTDIIAATAGVK
jgi:ankyrin repeat protein